MSLPKKECVAQTETSLGDVLEDIFVDCVLCCLTRNEIFSVKLLNRRIRR